MTQAIISIFIAFALLEEFNLQFRISAYVSKRIASWKVLRCLPCFTFWTSNLVGLIMWIWFDSSIGTIIINSMTAFIVAVFLDNRNK